MILVTNKQKEYLLTNETHSAFVRVRSFHILSELVDGKDAFDAHVYFNNQLITKLYVRVPTIVVE